MPSIHQNSAVLLGLAVTTALALPSKDLGAELQRRAACDSDTINIVIENRHPNPLVLHWENGIAAAGDPPIPGACNVPIDANVHFDQSLGPGDSWTATVPEGWSGAVGVVDSSKGGPAGGGTRIEPAYLSGIINYDVSMAEGFSVPVVCSADTAAMSGCNLDLWSQPDCPAPADSGICHNKFATEQTTQADQKGKLLAAGVAGLSDADPKEAFSPTWYRNQAPWFAPCQAGAYIGQYDDDGALKKAQPGVKEMRCCIGAACDANPSQAGWDWKSKPDTHPLPANVPLTWADPTKPWL